jgi:hypothetical protein
MGGFLRVIFDFGDYSPMSQNLILPYTIPGYAVGAFGELSGNLQSGHFKGMWFSNPFGNVGIFDIIKNNPSGSII